MSIGPSPWGSFNAVNITGASVLKASPGVIIRVQVLVAGTTAGAVYDANAAANVSQANQVGVIPAVVGTYDIGMPCGTGIVIVPGTSQVLAASYE